MPIFALNEQIIFPPVNLAERSGILAVGGDLSPERLIEAYRRGIFPWYSEGDPIIWWSPDPRFVLFPAETYISKTMRQVLRRKVFEVSFDRDFRAVMRGCQGPRKREKGTWITEEMMEAYIRLHESGIAHSIATWQHGELMGGLYGISLGRCFFGESMFTRVSNASKAAFITLSMRLRELGFVIIDCQVYTSHLESLGARHITRDEYIAILEEGLMYETIQGSWGDLIK
jgi:leucyl/phenylalanyl-tRNA--protein transferase